MVALRFCSVFALAASVLGAPIAQRGFLATRETCPDFCRGAIFKDPQYICGDFLLGPVVLPAQVPLDFGVADIVSPYDRFGGLCPGDFLSQWSTNHSYNYPPQDGFQLDTGDKAIKGNITLPFGALIDRFGGEGGRFLAPAYAPYIQRALPPVNLDTDPNNPQYPNSYHVYKVEKPFVVSAGPIAAWFGQPGQGTQYQAYDSVNTLLSGGFLSRSAPATS